MNPEAKLQQLVEKQVNHRSVFGASLCVEQERSGFRFLGSAGNLSNDRQHFIASTTKLYTTALILQLQDEGKLHLEDPIRLHCNADLTDRLHLYKNKDYSAAITVRHLLAHTSGLPDYFQGKTPDGGSLEKELMSGKDRSWNCTDAVEMARKIKPSFAPGTPGKALYSDTNFQLLGHIIENKTGQSFAIACRERIIDPVGLKNTYVYTDPSDRTPQCLYYKREPLEIYKAMSSFAADGGIVSTATDSMLFLKAFFGGAFFPRERFPEMMHWNRIFFPLHYGVGIARFKVPWIFSPFKSFPEIIGHSGLSGAFAFYCPEKDLYLSGTVNQVAFPATSFQFMIRVLSLF